MLNMEKLTTEKKMYSQQQTKAFPVLPGPCRVTVLRRVGGKFKHYCFLFYGFC